LYPAAINSSFEISGRAIVHRNQTDRIFEAEWDLTGWTRLEKTLSPALLRRGL
jgi:hypothetical protein